MRVAAPVVAAGVKGPGRVGRQAVPCRVLCLPGSKSGTGLASFSIDIAKPIHNLATRRVPAWASLLDKR
jgi:hypothetical protein